MNIFLIKLLCILGVLYGDRFQSRGFHEHPFSVIAGYFGVSISTFMLLSMYG